MCKLGVGGSLTFLSRRCPALPLLAKDGILRDGILEQRLPVREVGFCHLWRVFRVRLGSVWEGRRFKKCRKSGEIGKEAHEQEFESGRVVLDRLFVLAQRECTLRVIERVADGRRWIRGWLSLLLAADGNLDEYFQNESTMGDLRGHVDVRDGVLVERVKVAGSSPSRVLVALCASERNQRNQQK